MADDTVYVASSKNGQSSVYHTDADCPHLAKARKVTERQPDSLFENMSECHHCKTGQRGPKSSDFSIYRAAVAAGKARNGDDEVDA